MQRRSFLAIGLLTVCAGGALHAQQLEELFSQHVQIRNPVGDFPPRLIRLQPPTGDGWKSASVPEAGLKLRVPSDATVDTTHSESRVLRVQLAEAAVLPKPVFRVDVFTPKPGEAILVDEEYAQEYAEQYSQQAFQGKFTVTESGMVTVQKVPLAMVGGTYLVGAATAFRMQWSYLSKERQVFLTFDCPAAEWENFTDRVGRMILSVELPRAKKGK